MRAVASSTHRRAEMRADLVHERAQRAAVVQGVLEAEPTVIVTPTRSLVPLELRRDAHLLIVVDFT